MDERTRLVGVDFKDTALMKQELAKGRETVKEAMAMMKAEDVGDLNLVSWSMEPLYKLVHEVRGVVDKHF